MRSATWPALAVRSTRTWLAPGILGLTSPGSPASHVPVNLHAHSHSLPLPTSPESVLGVLGVAGLCGDRRQCHVVSQLLKPAYMMALDASRVQLDKVVCP